MITGRGESHSIIHVGLHIMLRVCVGLGGKCFLGCVGWVVVNNNNNNNKSMVDGY